MVNMTLSLPADLHAMMAKHKDIHWAEVARQAFRRKAREVELMDRTFRLKRMDELVAKSKLTEKDAEEIGRMIKREIAKDMGLL
jgi:hypothetical protein